MLFGGVNSTAIKNDGCKSLIVVRPERFELPASWFVARRSIQLSYGRALNEITAVQGREGGITQALRAFAPLGPPSRGYPLFVALAANRSNPTKIYLTCGGEGGIRTLEGLLTLTPLAGARLRPLGHLSGGRNHKDPESLLAKTLGFGVRRAVFPAGPLFDRRVACCHHRPPGRS